MASKKRDYKKEYARRVALGKTRNISKSQARGHARVKYGESSIKQLREAGNVSVKERIEEQIKKFYAVVNRVAKGESLTSATKQEHLSRQTFDRLNGEYGNYLGKTYKASAKGGKAVHAGYARSNPDGWMVLVDKGHGKFEEKFIEVVQGSESSHVSHWHHSVFEALHGETASIEAFKYNPIHDIHGNVYTLVTDVDTLHLWKRSQSASEAREWNERFYIAAKASS